MSSPTTRTVVRPRHVEQHVRRAIASRLRGGAGAGVISVERDEAAPQTVIVHVNSGGNAHAAEVELRRRGYWVEPTTYDPFAPGHYGVQLRIGPWPTSERAPRGPQHSRLASNRF